MRTFNKIILFGMVLVSFIFAFCNIPYLTDTYASIGDTKKVDANLTTAFWVPESKLVELDNLKLLGSGEELNRTMSVTKEKSEAAITGKKPIYRKSSSNGSSFNNSSSTYSVTGNDIVNLTALNLTSSNITDMDSPDSETSTEQTTAIFPVANFTCNVTKGCVPLSVQFVDLSQNVIEWNWDFGDGVNSKVSSPTHTYSLVGNYTVYLNASNLNGTHSKFVTINVLEEIVSLVIDSSINVTDCYTPISVQFTDLPKNTTQWSCDSENKIINLPASNSSSSHFSNSTHTKAIKRNRFKQTTFPVTNSSVNMTKHYTLLSVELTDISKNETKWKRDSREGDNSTQQNSTHTYFEVQNYTVDLIATNTTDENIKSREIYEDEIPKVQKHRKFKWK
jgi:PKD repeat protein